jgi:hypothetical protein
LFCISEAVVDGFPDGVMEDIGLLRLEERISRHLPAAFAAGFEAALLHVSFNPIRLTDKNMQQIKVLQRPLRV